MARESSPGCLRPFLIGCAILLVMGIGAIATGAYLLFHKRNEIAAAGINLISSRMIEDSSLSPNQREQVLGQIERVTRRLSEGRLTIEQLRRVHESFLTGKLGILVLTSTVDSKWIEEVGLAPEEVEVGRRSAQRVQRGVVEGKIAPDTFANILRSVSGEEVGERRGLTTEEWRAALAELKKSADAAGIPDEPFSLNLPEELRKLVDEILVEETFPLTEPTAAGVESASGEIQGATKPGT
ncbi:MAG: hypothetical protein GHCLOJNM_01938 [bacterium]|nr:hypothetical protein [bacterium]